MSHPNFIINFKDYKYNYVPIFLRADDKNLYIEGSSEEFKKIDDADFKKNLADYKTKNANDDVYFYKSDNYYLTIIINKDKEIKKTYIFNHNEKIIFNGIFTGSFYYFIKNINKGILPQNSFNFKTDNSSKFKNPPTTTNLTIEEFENFLINDPNLFLKNNYSYALMNIINCNKSLLHQTNNYKNDFFNFLYFLSFEYKYKVCDFIKDSDIIENDKIYVLFYPKYNDVSIIQQYNNDWYFDNEKIFNTNIQEIITKKFNETWYKTFVLFICEKSPNIVQNLTTNTFDGNTFKYQMYSTFDYKFENIFHFVKNKEYNHNKFKNYSDDLTANKPFYDIFYKDLKINQDVLDFNFHELIFSKNQFTEISKTQQLDICANYLFEIIKFYDIDSSKYLYFCEFFEEVLKNSNISYSKNFNINADYIIIVINQYWYYIIEKVKNDFFIIFKNKESLKIENFDFKKLENDLSNINPDFKIFSILKTNNPKFDLTTIKTNFQNIVKNSTIINDLQNFNPNHKIIDIYKYISNNVNDYVIIKYVLIDVFIFKIIIKTFCNTEYVKYHQLFADDINKFLFDFVKLKNYTYTDNVKSRIKQNIYKIDTKTLNTLSINFLYLNSDIQSLFMEKIFQIKNTINLKYLKSFELFQSYIINGLSHDIYIKYIFNINIDSKKDEYIHIYSFENYTFNNHYNDNKRISDALIKYEVYKNKEIYISENINFLKFKDIYFDQILKNSNKYYFTYFYYPIKNINYSVNDENISFCTFNVWNNSITGEPDINILKKTCDKNNLLTCLQKHSDKLTELTNEFSFVLLQEDHGKNYYDYSNLTTYTVYKLAIKLKENYKIDESYKNAKLFEIQNLSTKKEITTEKDKRKFFDSGMNVFFDTDRFELKSIYQIFLNDYTFPKSFKTDLERDNSKLFCLKLYIFDEYENEIEFKLTTDIKYELFPEEKLMFLKNNEEMRNSFLKLLPSETEKMKFLNYLQKIFTKDQIFVLNLRFPLKNSSLPLNDNIIEDILNIINYINKDNIIFPRLVFGGDFNRDVSLTSYNYKYLSNQKMALNLPDKTIYNWDTFFTNLKIIDVGKKYDKRTISANDKMIIDHDIIYIKTEEYKKKYIVIFKNDKDLPKMSIKQKSSQYEYFDFIYISYKDFDKELTDIVDFFLTFKEEYYFLFELYQYNEKNLTDLEFIITNMKYGIQTKEKIKNNSSTSTKSEIDTFNNIIKDSSYDNYQLISNTFKNTKIHNPPQFKSDAEFQTYKKGIKTVKYLNIKFFELFIKFEKKIIINKKTNNQTNKKKQNNNNKQNNNKKQNKKKTT